MPMKTTTLMINSLEFKEAIKTLEVVDRVMQVEDPMIDSKGSKMKSKFNTRRNRRDKNTIDFQD